MQDLNNKQLDAVMTTEGYVRVIAGAGSGKTRMLVNRYLYIVKELGISTKNVLCLTFSTKAVNEMKQRIKQLLNGEDDLSFVTTFHGLGAMIIRDAPEKFFYSKSFQIIDREDQKQILSLIYEDLEIKMNNSTFEKLIDKIEAYKADLKYIDYMIDTKTSTCDIGVSSLKEEIFKRYMSYQKKHCLVDFSDLINFATYMLMNFDDVRNYWTEKINYCLVDEYQDSTFDEVRLVDLITSVNKNLLVVGDPDQNIYEWRGSRMSFLVDFDKTHIPTKTIVLDENYRSTPNILSCANKLISNNTYRYPKDLFTNNSRGSEVEYYLAKTDQKEAKWICDNIASLVKQNEKYNDISILYRASYLSRKLENKLMEYKIPYEIVGNVKFYQRKEIKDLVAYMKLAIFDDDFAFRRIINVPKRGFGKIKMNKLFSYTINGDSLYEALKKNLDSFNLETLTSFVSLIEKIRNNKNLNALEIFDIIMTESGYEKYIREDGNMERFSNVIEFRNSINEFLIDEKDAKIEDLLNFISLQSDKDQDIKDKVKLMTIHSSKGLEFKNVFVMGLNDDIFPSKKTIQGREKEGLEEERRLCYVAITRAMGKLYLSSSSSIMSDTNRKTPSRFLYEIGEENIKNLNLGKKELKYSKGCIVEHKFFGEGEIVEVDHDEEVYKVSFNGSKNLKHFDFSYEFESVKNTEEEASPSNVLEIIPSEINDKEEDEEFVFENLVCLKEDNLENELSDLKESNDLSQEEYVFENFDFVTQDNVEDLDLSKLTFRCVMIKDLGRPSETCEFCSKENIRYIHYMKCCEKNLILKTGVVCAGILENNKENALSRERSFKNRIKRKANFLKTQFKVSKKGNLFIKYRNNLITLYKISNNNFKVYINGISLEKTFTSIIDALDVIFDKVDRI